MTDIFGSMDAEEPVYSRLSGELLKHLAEAYDYLMELAERDPNNIALCQGILSALSEFDIQAGRNLQATSPYVELNEYFLYLVDIQKPPESKEQRAYEEKTLEQFKAMVMAFVRKYAADLDEPYVSDKHESLKPIEGY